MEKELVARFDTKRDEIKSNLAAMLVEDKYIDYFDIVKTVIEAIHDGYGTPDPEKIHVIDDGDYQGTLIYVIPEKCYQPYDYWYVRVHYGSCSGCDTLQGILYDYDDFETKVNGLFTLALHIVQGLKKIGND